MTQTPAEYKTNYTLKSNSYYIKAACLFFSLCLLIACPVAATYLNCWERIFSDFYQILTMPSPLVTDYFYLGNMASAFFNAGLCGLACTLIMIINKTDCPPSFLAGYFLVIAHCFYGLNFLNMWPPMFGIFLFCRLMKIHFNENLDMAMFSTAFGPFISEMLFRYHVDDNYIVWKTQISFLGFSYAVIFSIFLGFAIPAMLPGALRLHKGFNLFNGGLAFGLLGLFIYSYMYKTFGVTAPTPLKTLNVLYNSHGNSYAGFIITFFSIIFLSFLICGWFMNGKSFKGYEKLLESTGHRVNFFETYGPALVYINIGVYGFMMLFYSFVYGMQNTLAKSADSLGLRTVKFALGSFIPIVGGTVSDAFSAVREGLGYVKAMTGAGGILILLCMVLPVAVSVWCFHLVLSCSQTAAELLDCTQSARLLADTQSILQLLSALVWLAVTFFCFSIILFTKTSVHAS